MKTEFDQQDLLIIAETDAENAYLIMLGLKAEERGDPHRCNERDLDVGTGYSYLRIKP